MTHKTIKSKIITEQHSLEISKADLLKILDAHFKLASPIPLSATCTGNDRDDFNKISIDWIETSHLTGDAEIDGEGR